ncbi:hypothetical protein [Eupransor demetentiae]|uniref:Uncharacterized protein n=1 Tax=Eupransor demetentiae TaxID=3109584 RepID=A0ABM9N491_9LACO|nr:hypothetical protein R54876_GBNLAHCA_00496 [Lactobacillaceae bacterium LMG 33000]
MLTKLFSTRFKSDEYFESELNKVLEDLQNQDHEIVDVKFNRWARHLSALILYK